MMLGRKVCTLLEPKMTQFGIRRKWDIQRGVARYYGIKLILFTNLLYI